mmetsp:Transcript_7679/g.11393  ORF Transcript_7679/g.11393 Transcript_7679/m.11393 type:complete len:294 (+) Transcript_7679:75-956(+)|eukprot:CAMPEP_0185026776 /NCGR_PEP_ID=MMETSP1103-20130426/11171_1 /TAXON_ID=36769 /ORGANISM="Paraphysomonas bandaiensis, Strain Caron Lab Isolate" /LENGTH=293 /DNA_ID=CAMNT_0027560467 /DNA_START=28 /DNA_END=909 /DNA_ORIENTATION=-
MPQKHSKNNGDATHFRYHEKVKAGLGSICQRLGAESQLPFGYCSLSLQPVSDAVVSPSGHIYEREAILEYLLKKTKELKRQAKLFDEEQAKLAAEEASRREEERGRELEKFAADVEGVSSLVKRKASAVEEKQSYMASRQKIIDDTDRETDMKRLKEISPWIPQFTPGAAPAPVKRPSKRPPSPNTQRPLRASDLVPLNMHREDDQGEGKSGAVKFICPVSRKTITSQKAVAIRNTNEIMLESVAKELAYPTMTCPVTGKKFTRADVIPLTQAASAFASTGQVEAKKYRPNMN